MEIQKGLFTGGCSTVFQINQIEEIQADIRTLEATDKFLESQEERCIRRLNRFSSKNSWQPLQRVPVPKYKSILALLKYKESLQEIIKSRENNIENLIYEFQSRIAADSSCRKSTSSYQVSVISRNNPCFDCLNVAKVVVVSTILAPVVFPIVALTLPVVAVTVVGGGVAMVGLGAAVLGAAAVGATVALGVATACLVGTAILVNTATLGVFVAAAALSCVLL